MTISRRRVLLSCFSCSPLWGSEPGVGWHWLLELTKRHDVVLVTHAFYREHLEPALAANPIAGLEIHYCSAPAFGRHPHKQLNSRLFYIWWQWHLKQAVKLLLKTHSFDLIHHLTWGTFRFPTFLVRMGVPMVMGPLGGGDVAPMRLYEGLPFRTRAVEWVRAVSLRLARFDPMATWGPKASVLLLCKTEDTLGALPASLRDRAVIALEIGSPVVDLSSRQNRSTEPSPFRLLFAGTLSGVKGIVLALGAVHALVKAGYDVTLDIAGKGPLRTHIWDEVVRLGLTMRVRLLGMIPRQELMALYGQADLFVFPSLHDSSGNVVLESLSRGLPVVCLDLGGPKYYVTSECGIVVSTGGQSRAQVEQGLASAIAGVIDDPEKLRCMSAEAVRQATIQTWEARVTRAYELIEQKLNWTDA
jgi:glycosyltransferase involved in cell wall biosynthesis